MVYVAALIVVALSLLMVKVNFTKIKKMGHGTAEMSNLSRIIQRGARTFMVRTYLVIIIVVAIVAVLFSLFIETWAGLTFVLGACMSSAACIIGMEGATYANVRTTNVARESKSIGETVKVALMGGSISGLCVQSLGILGFVVIMLVMGGVDTNATGHGLIGTLTCNPTTMRLTTYSLGCSLVAMFNRVAGGNYTKAADISADIVAKNRYDLPEDDARMPNTVADFIGDNVNDIAGNCSDLLESFVATIVASILIAVSIYRSAVAAGDAVASGGILSATIIYPVILAGGGLLACLIGLLYASLHKASDDPAAELNRATYISAGLVIVIGAAAAKVVFGSTELYQSFALGWISPWVAAVLGIISGVVIGKITEYYTSTDFRPVKGIANMAKEGEAFVVTKGDAVGSMSCFLPIAVIGVSLIISGAVCGFYGIAIAALGMLSFVATTVSIDAFGPIADNAGGIAESCHLPRDVRQITDKLDAVGNTTAAIGKGFAIGSAAFATVSLVFAYVGNFSDAAVPVLNIASVQVIVGALIGAGLVEMFIAILTNNTIDSAYLMAEEGDRQLSREGVLEGKVAPDYELVVRMAADEALRKMLVPSILALVIPIVAGFIFGVELVGGLLIGATLVAIPRAIFMGNSGGAFDNAKKLVEQGLLPGYPDESVEGFKAIHMATVVGDTVGDTRKDVVGVALDIFIKTMSTVANTLAPIFFVIHLL